MYFSPANGTHRVQGMIMGKYAELGYEGGWLGFPKTSEIPVKDGGRFNQFEGGNIYWSPLSGAWAVENGPIFDAGRAQATRAAGSGSRSATSSPFPVAYSRTSRPVTSQ